MKAKKLLALILAAAMILSTMTMVAFADDTVSVWDGTAYSLDWLSTGNPEGTAGETYYLNSAEDLAGLAYYVNTYAGSNNIFTGDTVYLNVDVDLKDYDWDPIGTAVPGEKNRFYGSFDGQGHTISNLKVAEGHYYAGLFGQIATYNYSQTFSNITLNNVVAHAEDETETGDNKEGAGALIGRANGTIIKDCHVTGTVDISADRFVGGLLGHSYAQISDCSVEASGTINADTWQAGGLVGAHCATATYTASINNCSVNGGTIGLAVTSYYAEAGGAIGNVSVSGVDSTPVDGIAVANVSVEAKSTDYGSGVALVASGYSATNATVENVTTTVADDASVPSDAEAKLNGVYYTSFYEAVKNAQPGNEVELLCDVSYDVWNTIWNKTDLTINGNGHTVTIGDVDSNGNGGSMITKSQNITINNLNVVFYSETDMVIIMNGGALNKVNVTGGAYAFSVDGDVTVEDCNFEGQKYWAFDTESVPTSLSITGCTFDENAVILRGSNNTFTDNVITNAGEGVNVLGNAVIKGNDFGESSLGIDRGVTVTVENNIINNVELSTWLEGDYSAVTVESNTLSEAALETLKTIDENVVSVPVVAKVNGKSYYSLADAIEAAKTVENPVIEIFEGTYNAFTVPAELNNVTFIGETDADGNNLVTIRTLEDDVDTNTRGICVAPETATFKNFNITAGTSTNRGGWMTSSLGNTNGDTGFRSNLKQLNVENVNFTGSGAHSAIWINNGSVNFVNSTVENYAYGVYVYSVKDGQVVNVTGSELSTSNRAIFNQEGSTGGKVEVTDSVIDAPMLTVGAGVPATFTGNDISNVTFYIYGETDMTSNSLIDCEYNTAANGVINLSANYVNNVNDIVDMADVENINFVSYYSTQEDLANKANLVPVKEKAAKVYVQYRKVDVATDEDGNETDTVEGSDEYEIVLAGADAEKINELASADLTFVFNGTPVDGGAMSHEVTAADGVTLSQLGDRYMFNYNGVDKYEETGAAIVIGTITVKGYGSYTLSTAAVDTNAVYATEIRDNIVDGFTPAAGLEINKDMIVDDGMVGEITDGNVAVPTRLLTVNVSFPNNIVDQVKDYQDMKVTISGGDLKEAVELDLGSDVDALVDGEGVVKLTDDKYVVTKKLTLERTYVVTVTGEGYRTARCTVNMASDKTLNFWNNVMDDALYVEEGKGTKTRTTFLAGDIVADNHINIYDLSAVVSYFGEIELQANNPEYVKYDLNRDGKIDSKDVALVLVSWNN